MANEEQLAILRQGADVWNKWQQEKHKLTLNIRINSPSASNQQTEFALKFTGADLIEADLSNANLEGIQLSNANLYKANLSRANLQGADLSKANLNESNLIETNLRSANLKEANITIANLTGSDLRDANLSKADLFGANLTGANLTSANLFEANLHSSYFTEANLTKADLTQVNLTNANLTSSILHKSKLSSAILVATKVDKSIITGSSVYGVNVWDLDGEFKEQRDLVITPDWEPTITVDNIKVAQFIYLIINNEEIRDAINTLTSKSVLILGRFAIPERKLILDLLRSKLREYGLVPIVFDFDRPTDKDFTETIKTLAGLSYFVIADVTNPKSSPLELQATIPDYQIPFVPIIQEGESPFAMMVDLQKKYNWVLNTVSYDSEETLMKVLKPLIIDPAMEKRQELRVIKAYEPEAISGREYVAKGKL